MPYIYVSNFKDATIFGQYINIRHSLLLSRRIVQSAVLFQLPSLQFDTITELERRKLEENSRLYYPPREEQTVPYVYILPKNGSVFKVRYINIGYSIGKSLGGCDTDQLEIVMVKTSGRWDIITAYPCS